MVWYFQVILAEQDSLVICLSTTGITTAGNMVIKVIRQYVWLLSHESLYSDNITNCMHVIVYAKETKTDELPHSSHSYAFLSHLCRKVVSSYSSTSRGNTTASGKDMALSTLYSIRMLLKWVKVGYYLKWQQPKRKAQLGEKEYWVGNFSFNQH